MPADKQLMTAAPRVSHEPSGSLVPWAPLSDALRGPCRWPVLRRGNLNSAGLPDSSSRPGINCPTGARAHDHATCVSDASSPAAACPGSLWSDCRGRPPRFSALFARPSRDPTRILWIWAFPATLRLGHAAIDQVSALRSHVDGDSAALTVVRLGISA